MGTPVPLSRIIEGMESQSEEMSSYLNKRTGEVVGVSDEELRAAEDDEDPSGFPEWQQDAIRTARQVVETDDYVSLPSEFDIHEYAIMEEFCNSLTDEKIRNRLLDCIRGRGAFRRFKDGIEEYGIAKDWYAFRDRAYRNIAVEWCEENGVEYTDD